MIPQWLEDLQGLRVLQSVELAQPCDSGFHAHAEGPRVVLREIVDAEGLECSALCLDEDRLGVYERSIEVECDGGRAGEAMQGSDGERY